MNPCFGAAVAPVYIFLLPSHRPQASSPYSEGLRNLDWIGSILFLAAVMTIFMALSFGGTLYAWDSLESSIYCAALPYFGSCLVYSRKSRS